MKEIKTTKLIPPGKAVIGINIPDDLEPGEYLLIIKVNAYLNDAKTKEVNGANIKTKIIIH